MKVEKFVKLTVDFEHIDISPEWVAFSVSRTIEGTYTQKGIINRNAWNNFLEDPFSTIDRNKVITHDIILIDSEVLNSQPSFKKIMLDEESENLLDFYQDFDYEVYKKILNVRFIKKIILHKKIVVKILNFITYKT